MNTLIPQHSPTPEFRASLEQELLRALREEDRALAPSLPPSLRWMGRPRLRMAAAIAAGLLLGIGTQYASAQVQESRQKSELERVKESERQVAVLRLMLARATTDQQQAGSEVGGTARRAVRESMVAARAAETEVARIDLELAEIRATAKAPRDELWAPLVGERDFVKERLRVTALAAQLRLAEAESLAQEVERRMAAEGMIEVRLLEESRTGLAQARQEFNRLAMRLRLREQFLQEALAPEEVTRRIENLEIQAQAMRVQEMLKVAEARLARMREQRSVGNLTELDVKRAELELLERQVEMQRLMVRLKAIEKP
jgi:hypothetical protein